MPMSSWKWVTATIMLCRVYRTSAQSPIAQGSAFLGRPHSWSSEPGNGVSAFPGPASIFLVSALLSFFPSSSPQTTHSLGPKGCGITSLVKLGFLMMATCYTNLLEPRGTKDLALLLGEVGLLQEGVHTGNETRAHTSVSIRYPSHNLFIL